MDPLEAVRVVIEDFEEDETPLQGEMEAKLIARICKRAAVKAGKTLTRTEQEKLLLGPGRMRIPTNLPARPANDDPSLRGSAGKAIWAKRQPVGPA